MKIQSRKTSSRDGGALLMVLLTMLFVSIMQLGLMKLQETSAVESVFVEDYKQAFWLAESGITDGQALVQFDTDFRNNPYAVPVVNVSSVRGSYAITVTKALINLPLQKYEYTIRSVGTANGVSREIQQKLLSVPGANNIIIGKSGVTDLAGNNHINGSIAQIEGTLFIKDSRLMDGYIIMGDGEDALTDRKGEAVLANYPPPPPPVIVYDKYQTALNKLASSTNLHELSISENKSALSGTIYYKADSVTIGANPVTIADGTTIVATGSINFSKSHVTIGKNVTIIANDFSLSANHADIGAGSVIFSKNNINIANASDSTSSGGPGVTLLALGDITFASQNDFRGIIFAEGKVDLSSNTSVEGTVIGGTGIDTDAQTHLTYDPSVFSAGIPIDPLTFGGVILTQISWLEIPIL